MLQRAAASTPSVLPLRQVRVLIEDPAVVSVDLPTPAAVDVVACTGPHDEREVCPLVTDGRCPLGRPDVVVTALEGPWDRSVRAAWTETGTPLVDARDVVTTDPAERLAHHVGAALQRLWPTQESDE